MYKNTRHTKKMWTYRSESICAPWSGTEEEGRKIVEHSKAVVFDLCLLRPEEYIFDNNFPGGVFTFGKLVNDRLRRATAFLRKRAFPDAVIKALPSYFLITPKLGTVLSRLERRSLHQVPAELHELFQYLKSNGVPQHSKARPIFSSAAVRVRAKDLPSPPKKPALSQLEIARLQKNSKKKKPKEKSAALDLSPDIGDAIPIVKDPSPVSSVAGNRPSSKSTKSISTKSPQPVGPRVPIPKQVAASLQTAHRYTTLLEAFKRALAK